MTPETRDGRRLVRVWRRRETWLHTERLAAFRTWLRTGTRESWIALATLTRICSSFGIRIGTGRPAPSDVGARLTAARLGLAVPPLQPRRAGAEGSRS